MPIDYTQYPKNWFTEIRPTILVRENWACKFCGLSNGKRGYRDQNGIFIECDEFLERWCEKVGKKVFRIVLTIAHLDHNRDNNSLDNLAALCQKCHLNHDKEQHILTRKINASNKREREKNEKKTFGKKR